MLLEKSILRANGLILTLHMNTGYCYLSIFSTDNHWMMILIELKLSELKEGI